MSDRNRAKEPTTDEELHAATIGAPTEVNGQILLVAYDPEWPVLFAREAAKIRAALGERALMIEHAGSTSVPGLMAKPIIDIIVAVADSSDESAYVPALESAGYQLRIREPEWEQHRLLKGAHPEVNMHVFSSGSREITRMLMMRDWLRANEADRELYAATKRDLASRTWKYVQNYADAKTTVIAEIMARAEAARATAAAETSKADYSVAYLTDVEGIWEKLTSFCQDNPLVSLEPGDRLTVRPGATFVYGGDAIDRGAAGRRLMRVLLEAWRRQPSQVVMLAGNRDINKLRLMRELNGFPPSRAPAEVRAAPRPVLLRWIFENTMGAREAFAFRQEELTANGLPASDEAVVDSFLEDLGPGGLLRDYLVACRLVHRIGNTLFVHGGVHEHSVGHVPSRAPIEGVDAWAEALNRWYAEQLEAFIEWRFDSEGLPAWEPVIAYQAPTPGDRINTASVVYGRMADENNHPTLPSQELVARLTREGIHRLVVGHTPSGDSPSVVRGEDFELVLADNSYGRVEGASQLFVRDDSVYVEGRAKLDDGRLDQVRFQLSLKDSASFIGHQLLDTGQLVKGPLESGGWLLFRALPQRRIEQLSAAPAELAGRSLGPAR
ncbi:GrpB family protein [Hyalangium rubrum]|uniref:GrpB family protein n=1 Tax=Hyalangium rubrum TaxID=3103134 RepID=A0ABU5HGN4_9BACT|nr:GrpB family protein [Hyalangium sp. s54d21]MDY7232425.1 GrpB family protein [Hyalangium sp. s54d21]